MNYDRDPSAFTPNRLFNGLIIGSAAAAVALSSCSSNEAPTAPTVGAEAPAEPGAGRPDTHEDSPAGEGTMDPVLKERAARIISTFENSTTELQYGYAENIEDGRGITAGRAGFTSETYDLLEVVDRYTAKVPDNPLAQYLPALTVANETEDTVEEIPGFIEAWQSLGDDEVLRQTQDELVDEWYFGPAMARAEAVGVRSPLGKLIMWDTIIQHGEGNDPDGLPAIQQEVTGLAGTARADEAAWLDTFLAVREQHLTNAADPSTRDAWRDSVSRVHALRSLLESDNMDLRTPLEWTVYGDTFRLDG